MSLSRLPALLGFLRGLVNCYGCQSLERPF